MTMERRPKVYVVHEQKSLVKGSGGQRVEVSKDLSPAERFGELVRVVPLGRHGPDQQASIVDIIERKLDGITSEDYILPIGDPDWILAVGAVAAWYLGGRFRYLHWMNASYSYEPREMVIPSMLDEATPDDDQDEVL